FRSKIPAGHFRATGKTQTTFGIECTIDSVARQMGLSPYELRLKNVLRRGERVAAAWSVRGDAGPADAPPMDMDFPDMMRRAMAGIGWDGRPNPSTPTGGARAAASGTRRVARGRGLA